MTAGALTIHKSLSQFCGHIPQRRRLQLILLLVLMLFAALAEVATLGAVLPFLALIADPDRLKNYGLFRDVLGFLGWNDVNSVQLAVTMLFAVVAMTAGTIRVVLAWASNKFVFGLGHDLSVEVYRRTLYQPYGYHISNNTSEVVTAINKVQLVVGGLLLPLMQVTIAVTTSIFILGALVAIDPITALGCALGFSGVYVGIMAVTRQQLRANSRLLARSLPERVKTVHEGLGGIRDVLLDHAQSVFADKFRTADAGFQHAQAMNAFIGAAPRFAIESVGMVLLAFFGLFIAGREGGLMAALPVLAALALGAQRLLPLIQQIYAGAVQITTYRDTLHDVMELLGLPISSEQLDARSTRPLPFAREIALAGVEFAYAPDHPAVVRDIDLVIPKGARVGFIGKTGSGKSTLVDLIMGLLEPTEGTIRIDGLALNERMRLDWQKRIAHVPQAIFLSDTTIAENIAFGSAAKDIDIERMQEAARMAMIADFIATLPDGYNTRVGERGVRLSGGQRQRIGIARALYRRADVLVFDEATSALDNETEADVMRAIAGLRRDLTVLLIAHRLSTVAMCDLIVRMEDGRAVSVGSYNEVVLAGDVQGTGDAIEGLTHRPMVATGY